MRLLLDTHVLLWAAAEPHRLSAQSSAMIRDPANEVLVSLITLWEIVLKVRIGKLRLLLEELQHFMADQRIEQLPLTFDHLKALGELPSHHRDPFDHLLIAQAISEGLTLISADREFVDYPVRLVRC